MEIDAHKKMLTDSDYIREYLGSIMVRDYKKVKQTIMDRCRINSCQFYNWKQGLVRRIPAIYKEILNDIAQEHDGREIFPTEPGCPEA